MFFTWPRGGAVLVFCKLELQGQICDALHDLLPFVQFKKREKLPWKSVNFSKVAG